jgi:tetratricopeptide (TPR) repeat protein
VRIQEPFVLYRSYLWMPGLFAALPVAFGWFSSKKAFLMLSAISLLLIPLTLNRLNTFSSALLLWDDAEKLVKNKPYIYGAERIYSNLGNELRQLKRFDESIAAFDKAIATPHPLAFMYAGRAIAYGALRKYQEALRDLDQAIAMNPDDPEFYNLRAMAYRALGNSSAAQKDFTKSCAMGGHVGDLPCNRD